MSRLIRFGACSAVATLAVTGLLAGPVQASTPKGGAEVVGRLGYEGGAFPGTFTPTAGTVFVQFDLRPLELVRSVGASGSFALHLASGTYTLTGCGPGNPTSPVGPCGRSKTVTLTANEKVHVQLVWLLAP